MTPPGEGNPWASGIRGVINDLIEQGSSARAGLAHVREVTGLAVRDSTFYNLWAETQAARDMAAIHVNADYGALLGDQEYATWSAGEAGTYVHQVALVVKDIQTGADTTIYSSVASDTPLTRAEAVDQAIANMEQGAADDPGLYPVRVRGGFFLNAYSMTGRAR